MKRWILISLLLVLACENDPAYESGKPENRPEPTTMDEAAAQQAEKEARRAALRAKGLCSAQAIRAAPHPDERFWHCQGSDWTGKTILADTLGALRSDPDLYEDFCAGSIKAVREKLAKVDFSYQQPICEGTPADEAAKQRPLLNPIDDFFKKQKTKGEK